MRVGFDRASGAVVIIGNGSFLPGTLAASLNEAGETSAPTDGSVPTILLGSSGGQVALRKLQPSMQRSVFAPSTYVYDILATDPVAGLTVPAFFGTIEHLDGVTHLP